MMKFKKSSLLVVAGMAVLLAGCGNQSASTNGKRSEERRVGKECRSRWSPYH